VNGSSENNASLGRGVIGGRNRGETATKGKGGTIRGV
jgi:hypothetical protein